MLRPAFIAKAQEMGIELPRDVLIRINAPPLRPVGGADGAGAGAAMPEKTAAEERAQRISAMDVKRKAAQRPSSAGRAKPGGVRQAPASPPQPEPEPEPEQRGPPRAAPRPRPASARPGGRYGVGGGAGQGAVVGEQAAAQVAAGLAAARPRSANPRSVKQARPNPLARNHLACSHKDVCASC